MGNKLGRRQVVDERHTRPQGLYQLREIELKKLRKLILDYKLAPCYPGADECALDLDECPICFLNYPSLNRSRCCRKMICTECLLQLKASSPSKPTKCPFCKTSNYYVEYRGARTKQEKRREQAEEQRVVEAQIRMRVKELQADEERTRKRKEIDSSNRTIIPVQTDCSRSISESRRPPRSGQMREYTFDTDIDDIMIFEAMWLSVQDHGTQKNACNSGGSFSRQSSSSASISPTEESVSRVQSGVRDGGIGRATANLTVDSGCSPLSRSQSVAAASHLLTDNFEGQMMLALAVPLAEFRTATRISPGVTWLQ